MQFKASTDYGMRAILYLAAQGTTCSSKDIAQDMSIPRDYLIQLAQLLRNAGLIEARPGKHGGYRLAKEPSDITVLQIMKALEEDAKASTRAKRSSRKDGAMVQGVKQTYQLIEESFDAYLDSLTIEMLLESVKNGDNRRTKLPADTTETDTSWYNRARQHRDAVALRLRDGGPPHPGDLHQEHRRPGDLHHLRGRHHRRCGHGERERRGNRPQAPGGHGDPGFGYHR